MSEPRYVVRVVVSATATQLEDAFHFRINGATLPETAAAVQHQLTARDRELLQFTVAAVPFEVDDRPLSDAELFAMSINQGTLFEGTTFGIYEGNLDGAD